MGAVTWGTCWLDGTNVSLTHYESFSHVWLATSVSCNFGYLYLIRPGLAFLIDWPNFVKEFAGIRLRSLFTIMDCYASKIETYSGSFTGWNCKYTCLDAIVRLTNNCWLITFTCGTFNSRSYRGRELNSDDKTLQTIG